MAWQDIFKRGRGRPKAGEAPPRARRPEAYPRGISGTRATGGRIYGYEKNPRFADWRTWADTGYEMLRTDPKLAGADSLLRHTLLSVHWEVMEGKGPRAAEYALYARQALGLDGERTRMDEPFEAQIAKMLPFASIGARYLEEIYALEDGKWWLKTWADREPTAHKDWVYAPNGDFAGVTQYLWNQPETYEAIPIPANKMLLLTLNKTGQNFEGRGMLRPCYSWWKLKDFLQQTMSVGYERWAVPTPKILTDREKGEDLGYTAEEIDTMSANAVAEAQAFVAMDQSYLKETPVVTFGVYGEGTMDAKGPLELVKYADQAMLTAWTMHFMELGLGDVGSRAVGMVHENAFRRAAINILDQIANAISAPEGPGRGTLARLLRWNFGDIDRDALPTLVHRGLDVDALVDALGSIGTLIQNGALTPEDSLESHLRGRIGLGKDLPAGAVRTAQERLDASSSTSAPSSRGGRPSNPVPA